MSIIEWRVIPWWARACSCSPAGSIVAFPPVLHAGPCVGAVMPACCPYHTVVCAHPGAGEVPMEMAMATVLAPCTYPCIHDRFRSDVSLIHGPLRPSGAAAPPAGLHHQKSRTNHRYPYPPPSLFISLFSYWHAVRVNFMSSFYAPASYLHWKQK
jgi:hypothetical protein